MITASNLARDKPKGWWLDSKAHGIVEQSHPIIRKLDERRAAVSAKLQERAKKAKATDKVARATQRAAAKQRMKESKARAAVEEVQKNSVGEEGDDGAAIENNFGAAVEDDFGAAMDYAFAEMDAGHDDARKEWTDEDDMRLMVALDADLANDEAKKAAAKIAADEAAAVENAAAEAAAEDDDDHDSLFDE